MAADKFPSPWGEGQGEGKRRGESIKYFRDSPRTGKDSVRFFRRVSIRGGPAIFRHWFRSAFLQRLPNGVADEFFVPAGMSAPETKDFHARMLQPGVAFGISCAMFRRAVLKAIELDVQRGLNAEEIENVRTERMLAAKLIAGKAAISKPFPHESFRPRIVLAKETGHLERSHGWRVSQRTLILQGFPSPQGEGGFFTVREEAWRFRNDRWQQTSFPLLGERVRVRGNAALNSSSIDGDCPNPSKIRSSHPSNRRQRRNCITSKSV